MLTSIFSSSLRLLVNVNMPCAVAQRSKGHIWCTGGELPITFSCLDITKRIEGPNMCPVVLITGVCLGLPEKRVNIMAYAECWGNASLQGCIEDPLVNC